jgi:hypothetical protein
MINMEQPEAVNELLTRFIDGLPGPAAGARQPGYQAARPIG